MLTVVSTSSLELFLQPIHSGASCLSCCLIYKVHTALSGGLLSYHSLFPLSSTFFKFFQTFSCSHSRALCRVKRHPRRQPNYATTLGFPCQALFSSFFKLFRARSGRPSVVTAVLADSSSRISLLEPFVKHFFQVFQTEIQAPTLKVSSSISSNPSPARLSQVPHRKRSLIIAKSPPLVNTFFQVF